MSFYLYSTVLYVIILVMTDWATMTARDWLYTVLMDRRVLILPVVIVDRFCRDKSVVTSLNPRDFKHLHVCIPSTHQYLIFDVILENIVVVHFGDMTYVHCMFL